MNTRFLSPFFQFSTSYSYTPRYNIIRTKTGYTIQVAVPGYSREELEVNFSQGKLWVRSLDNLNLREDENDIFIEKGLSEKRFTLEFSVSAELTPKSVKLDKGILQLNFEKIDSQDSILEIKEGA
jgi:molecular chaperone IbpA